MVRLAAAALDADRADGLRALLGRAQSYLDEVWHRGSRYTNALATLHERLVEERLQVAVLGQFKRGKSTFLNALLGESLLPTGVVPLTAIPTFIHWGALPRSASVISMDWRQSSNPRQSRHRSRDSSPDL